MQLNVPPDLETLVNKSAHIEEGYLQAERGELIDGAQARREIQGMKDNRRQAGANPVIGDPDQGRGGKPVPETFHPHLQIRQVKSDNIVDTLKIDPQILMDQHIPETRDAMPVDFRMSGLQFSAHSLCRFGKDL